MTKRKIGPLNPPGPKPLIERLYKTPEELEEKVEEYFNGGAYKRKVITQLGAEVEIPTPTISDLVLFLGFIDRRNFYKYEDHPLFGDTIKKARTMIEREYEIQLRNQSCTGAIFALKNFGWIDRPADEGSGNVINQVITVLYNNTNGKSKDNQDSSAGVSIQRFDTPMAA